MATIVLHVILMFVCFHQAFSGKDSENDEDIFPFNTRALIRQLSELGFSKEDCTTALKECNGQLVKSSDNIQIFLKKRIIL